VDNEWVLHKGDVPTTKLMPKWDSYTSPTLPDNVYLGADLAKHGLVPTGWGVMEGHGYKYTKNATTGQWDKVGHQNKPYTPPAPTVSKPSSYSSYSAPPPPPAWKPQPITLAANRKGVTDFDKHPSTDYAGFHGKAFTQDGDVVEGGSVRVLKVKGADGEDYYECMFKVTHPYGAAAQSYGTGSSESLSFRQRSMKAGVMKDNGKEHVEQVKTRIHKGDGHTVEVGASGAATNMVRMRAKSLAGLNTAMDDFSKQIGADLRKPPEIEDLKLQAKARLAAKFDPAAFGKGMQAAATPDQQKAVINDIFDAQAKKHPVLAKALEDAKELEVYPGHKTLYSKSLGKHMAEQWGALYHDGSPPADIAASIVGETGLMSSMKRFNSGVFTTGMSTSTDFRTGGADGVFMRVAKDAPTKAAGGSFRAVIDTEKVMGRLDWWAFDHDNYGRADYKNYESRWSVPDQKKTGYPSSGNEVMAPHGVPPSAFKQFIVSSESYRKEILAALEAKGIKEINGTPIAKFVVKGSNY
jgi:hypothetical protein